MACSSCGREKKVIGRGLCGACYMRWRKRGTTDYAPKRERQSCAVDDCDSPAVARGLCDTHRKRVERHGHIEETRPDSWGAIEKHSLRDSWRWIIRHRGVKDVHPDWTDFLQFVNDVGARPSKHHRLVKSDTTRPIGPDNFIWRESTFRKERGASRLEAAAKYQREYRALHPNRAKHADLAKHYRISLDDYEGLVEKQNGKCRICEIDETLVIRGKRVRLAVDHCHKTGKIRGLLCSACNKGLGGFKDSPDLLRKAAAYLESC